MIERRSKAISGLVNFPVDSPEYVNTQEGGMFVKLVVIDDHDPGAPEAFAKCCGVKVNDLIAEVMVGDDRCPMPRSPGLFASDADIKAEQDAKDAWLARHFPSRKNYNEEPVASDISRDYLAVLVMGSTGWSGFSDEHGYWTCTADDLSPEGKALYDQVAKLYPNATLHLLTFLDT